MRRRRTPVDPGAAFAIGWFFGLALGLLASGLVVGLTR